MSDTEEIFMLERRAEQASWESPSYANSLKRQADILRERQAQDTALWGELLEMSSDKIKAGELASMLSYQYELNQRVSRLASALYSYKLITPAQFESVKKRLNARTPTESKMLRESELVNEQYDATVQAIFSAVGLEHKSEARAAYNMVGGARGEDKLRDWVNKLIEMKLLPSSYRVNLRYSEGVHKMQELFLKLENK